MKKMSVAQARNLAVHSQLLHQKTSYKGKSGLQQIIEQIGYVQIDTISVVERAHHHILWSRVHRYQPEWLRQLEEERKVFEYWAHAASYLPMRDFRFSLIRKRSFTDGTSPWLRYFKTDKNAKAYIMDRIKAEGPLMSKDFKPKGKIKRAAVGMDWQANPMNMALRLLFMEGSIMVAHRKGFQKAYDLTERVLPEHVDRSIPSREHYIRHLIHRDVKAHGLVRETEIGYLLKGTGKDVQKVLRSMLTQGDLLEIFVERAGAKPFYTTPAQYEASHSLPARRALKLLSPFDNLVIQRQRTEELFHFKYILECYVPAAKRKFGYFCLPILKGNRLVGQIDLKADRKTKILWIRNLWWEDWIKDRDKYTESLRKGLSEFQQFNQCLDTRAEDGGKTWKEAFPRTKINN